jgi:aminoglycoside phosphotransferase (APT) family kinase protein
MARGDDLLQPLTEFCSKKLGHAVSIEGLTRLSGGASREMWSFTVDGRRLVLRREPPGVVPLTERSPEVVLLERAAEAGVPVPPVIWTATADELGSPGFFMEHIEGETIARKILRDDEYAKARDVMARQCGEIVAKIQTMPTEGLEMPATKPADAVLEQYGSLLQSLGEPHPVFELALRWLAERKPPGDRIVMVHGDFRNGNFIVGEEGIRAVLDWEIAHLGDPCEDLAWVCCRSWRFGAPGEVGGFGKRADLYAGYEAASGIAVDPDAVRWWEIMSSVKWGIMTILQAFTHLSGSRNSLEHAAIGRRTVETEYDVIQLMKEAN